MGIIIALISGALMSVQGVFNTEVTDQTSMWVAAGWVQLTAFVTCVAIWLFTGRQPVGGLMDVTPRYVLLGGILGALIGSYSFARPILKLVNTLKRVDGNQRLTMPSTGVKEVDELSDAVTGLNEKVRDNASK